MRVFHILPGSVLETDTLPSQPPAEGFVWIACGRREFELEQARIQTTMHLLHGTSLVDLHISDLLNNQLPSHFDYTSQYDILVFRRLAAGHSETDMAHPGQPLTQAPRRGGPPVLRRIDTSPVGFAVFDRVLLTVHPAGCTVLESYASRLLAPGSATLRCPCTRCADPTGSRRSTSGSCSRARRKPARRLYRVFSPSIKRNCRKPVWRWFATPACGIARRRQSLRRCAVSSAKR